MAHAEKRRRSGQRGIDIRWRDQMRRLNDQSYDMTEQQWPLWEVFIRSKQGLDHKHAGSIHAADAAMAIENAGMSIPAGWKG
jgi:hypothetical protein